MAQMTDPMSALVQFQEAFEQGLIPVQPGRRDRNLLFAPDTPNGHPRFNYMRADGSTLTALVMFAQNGLEDGEPVFNIGYAVPEAYRRHGLAKATLTVALDELSAGLAGGQGQRCRAVLAAGPRDCDVLVIIPSREERRERKAHGFFVHHADVAGK